ncbi:diaminopimelate epimerase [Desulfobotulus sp.]|jgi:diaminopimelate epimerase|uniref:diaminopimelate epimerase n=1 Tax=Desulfobotulus sp. TaxID=1940337 RepID=UPI002A36BB20|nr:diaminopimelate epimerase [Desulfobotulus sp.]MDY0162045.1 diaminopimelate epimerase [Desulfobotulus sp.]
MKYLKYHGLGNDYVVIHPADVSGDLSPKKIRLICDRNYGIGSDGILLGPLHSDTCDFRLRILNPDGSEAEKSGNGLRIFSRYLWDLGSIYETPFTVETLGGTVVCHVHKGGRMVTVEMGEVSFMSTKVPVAGEEREVLRESMDIEDAIFEYCAATVGNPHCVILCNDVSPELARHYGPLIETDSRFPNRTNVQFLKAIDRENIQIEIWERGAGYTLASGSSSTAAAAVAFRLGLCGPAITVHMPGGSLAIHLAQNFSATMTGPVTRVCEGFMDREMFEEDRPSNR